MSSAAASARITGPLEKAVSSTRTARSCWRGLRSLLDLDLDPDDPVVVLLEPGQLLLDMTAEPVGELAVPTGDHNVHVNLPLHRFDLSVRTRATPGAVARAMSGVRPADLVFDPTIAC